MLLAYPGPKLALGREPRVRPHPRDVSLGYRPNWRLDSDRGTRHAIGLYRDHRLRPAGAGLRLRDKQTGAGMPTPAPPACRRSRPRSRKARRAYLNRQYTTIGIVGVVILIVLGVTLGIHVAIGFVIGAVLSAAAGYRRHERLGACQRPHRPGVAARPRRRPRHRLQGGRHHRACWWSASACSASRATT